MRVRDTLAMGGRRPAGAVSAPPGAATSRSPSNRTRTSRRFAREPAAGTCAHWPPGRDER